jgi:hypothetical protein
MQQQEADDDDDDVQEELATQPQPYNANSASEDEGTPEAELIDDANLSNTEEAAASTSAIDIEPKILNGGKEEVGVQDKVVVEEEKREQEEESTVDPDEQKPSPTITSTAKEQHKEPLALDLPSSVLKEASIDDADEKTTTFSRLKGWLKPISVFNRSQVSAEASSEETKVAASTDAAASAAVTSPATAAVTNNTTTAAAVSANTGTSSVKPRSSPSTPRVVATAMARTPIVPSAEKPERRYKKILSAKTVLSGPSKQAAASRRLSQQSSPSSSSSSSSPPTTPHTASASKRKVKNLQSSSPKVAKVATTPTTAWLTTKGRTTAAQQSAEKKKRSLETPTLPAKKQKSTPASKSSAKSKSPAAATSSSKKRAIPREISSGPPDEPMEGGWPAGWRKSVVQRQAGATKGTKDRYWYTPTQEYKLRSMVEVKRFMKALADAKGDEKEAWGVLKYKK